jgi:hypothetical protein
VVIKHVPKSVFKEKYPDAQMADFENLSTWVRSTSGFQWVTDVSIKVADYYRVIEKKVDVILLKSGLVYELDDNTKKVVDELLAGGDEVVKSRKITKKHVERYRASGTEILEGPFTWPGSWIPIIECFGYYQFVDGEIDYWGKVKFAKDAQMLYNYTTKRLTELHDPIQATRKQMGNNAILYARYHELKPAVLEYTPDPQAPGKPERMSSQAGGSSELQALLTLLNHSDFAIKATMGDFGATQGIPESDQSGLAISRLQASADAGSFDLVESIARSIKFTWDTIVEVAPVFYDTARQLAVINDDGEDEIVTINQEVIDKQTGDKVLLNDISKGKYSVEVSIGPATKTQREQLLGMLADARANDPTLAQLSTDLFVKHLDAPFSPELSKRVRKRLLAEGLVEPNDEEKEQLAKQQQAEQNDPMLKIQEMVASQQLKKLQLENEEIAAKVDKLAAEHDKERADVGKTIAETIVEYANAGIPIRPADLIARSLQNQEMVKALSDQGNQGPQTPELSPTNGSPIAQEPGAN